MVRNSTYNRLLNLNKKFIPYKETIMNKVKLFYSYSHKDEDYRNELEIHLTTLHKKDLINEWHDRKIDAGNNWDDEIEQNMANSNIILLLFSPEFIGSPACQKEVKTAIKLKKEKNTILIPSNIEGLLLERC